MGTSFAVPIVLLVLIGLALGSTLNFAAAFLAIPIVAFLMLNFVLVSDTMARQRRIQKMRKFRNSSRTQKVPFTDKDKRTTV